ETAFYLAVGAMNMMHTIDPDMVVFGGGMIHAGEAFLDRIRWHVKRLAFPVPAEKTQILYAQLGSDAGFIGAAACGRLLVKRGARPTEAGALRSGSPGDGIGSQAGRCREDPPRRGRTRRLHGGARRRTRFPGCDAFVAATDGHCRRPSPSCREGSPPGPIPLSSRRAGTSCTRPRAPRRPIRAGEAVAPGNATTVPPRYG